MTFRLLFNFLRKNNFYFFLAIIFLFSLAPFFWFSNDQIINMADFDFSIAPTNDLARFSSVWNPDNLGKPGNGPAKLLLFQLPITFLSYLGLSLGLIQKILFFLILLTTGLGMFFLIKHFLKKSPYQNVAAFCGANFYMFNHFVFIVKWSNGYILSLYSYAVLPFILLFFIKYLNETGFKNLFYLLILAVLASPSGINTAHYIIIPSIILAWAVWQIIFEKNRFKILKKTTWTLFLLILTNLFWIIQLLIVFGSYQTKFIKNYKSQASILGLTNLADLFRSLGKDIFFLSYKGSKYFPFSFLYNSPFFILVGFVFLGLLIFYLINKRNKSRSVLFFFLLLIFSILFMKGGISPFKEFNLFLYDNFYPFNAFKHSYEKFGVFFLFSFSVLMAFVFNHFIKNIFYNKGKFIFVIVFILSWNFYNFPFFTGQIFPKYSSFSALSNFRIQLPKAYLDLEEFYNNDYLNYKLMGIPLNSRLAWIKYFWGFLGSDPLYHFTYQKSYFLPADHTNNISEQLLILDKVFHNYRNLKQFTQLVGIINIKNLILRNDVDGDFYKQVKDPLTYKEDLIKSLLNWDFFELKTRIGDLEIYQIKNNYFYPHFYIPQNQLITKRPLSSFLNLISSFNSDSRIAILFKEQNDSSILNNISYETPALPTVEYRKINPNKYRLRIHQAKNDFLLVFAEAFHQDWEIFLQKFNPEEEFDLSRHRVFVGNEDGQASSNELQELINSGHISALDNTNIKFISKNFKGSIQNDNLPEGSLGETFFRAALQDNNNHLTANGYANSWFIDLAEIQKSGQYLKNKDGSFDFELVIEFKPQKRFYLGILISILTFAGCFVYFCFEKYKTKHPTKNISVSF